MVVAGTDTQRGWFWCSAAKERPVNMKLMNKTIIRTIHFKKTYNFFGMGTMAHPQAVVGWNLGILVFVVVLFPPRRFACSTVMAWGPR